MLSQHELEAYLGVPKDTPIEVISRPFILTDEMKAEREKWQSGIIDKNRQPNVFEQLVLDSLETALLDACVANGIDTSQFKQNGDEND